MGIINERSLAGRIVRLAAAGLGAIVVVAGAGAYPTYRVSGWSGLSAAAAGCAIALAAGVVGSVPGCVLMDRSAEQAARGFLAGSVIRFVMTLLLGLPLALWSSLDETPLLIWLGIGYLAVLFAETLFAVRLMGRRPRGNRHD